MDWLWQNAAFEIIWKLGVMTLAGMFLTWARAKWPKYGQHVMPFLVITASIAVLWVALVGAPLLESKVTTDNIEKNIKDWADKFGLGITRHEDPNALFAFGVTVPNQDQILVERPRGRDQYLTFSGSVTVVDDQQKVMRNMSQTEKEKLTESLTAEFAKSGLNFGMQSSTNDGILTSVVFVSAIPITSKLTEDVFATDLDRIDNAVQLAKAVIRLNLAHPVPQGKG